MRRIIYYSIFVILVSIVVGYLIILVQPLSTQDEKEKNGLGGEQEDVVELTFWRNYGNAAENKAYNEILEDFHQSHPNIHVNMQNIEYANYEVELRTELVTGTGPDIMAIDSPYVALYAEADLLMPLNEFLTEKDGLEEDFSETIIEGLTYKDQLFLMPLIESSIALYYNMNLLEDANLPYPDSDPASPMTWEEVVGLLKQGQRPEEGIYGIDPAQGFGSGEAPAYFKLPIIWQFGGEAVSPDVTTASGYLDSAETMEALQFYQDLYHKDKVAVRELPAEAFENGQLMMTVLGGWAITDLEEKGLKLGEDFGIAPLPKSKYQVVPNGSWALGILSSTNHPEEAWEFIRYVTSYESMKKYSSITGEVPARYSVAEDIPAFNTYPYNIFAEQAYSYSRNRPVTPAYPDISKAIKKLFEDIGLANKDVEASVEEAVETINKRLREAD
ncbi:ABC transporter substrate-binding protein [Oceanobacillus sojae]|uniref:ABC transporter substrate-binding protein n=1 Tax=Oceanobacillus sojae TaxID=582851 RepID=UPI0021A55B46|nr:ABC transporter substrate-binding protein [Oceanobacillus sojae]MCT1902376.1 ABC transporter substrate-binding protein [Oceanobacillus sojae]